MSFPIDLNDRLHRIGDAYLPYLPMHGIELKDLIKKYDFNTLREPVVVSFTNKLLRTINVKGILDDIEVNPSNYALRPNSFNIVVLTFKGDKLTKLRGDDEEDFQIPGSEVIMRGNDVSTKVILVDGPSMMTVQKVPKACGRIDSIASLSTYEKAMLKDVV